MRLLSKLLVVGGLIYVGTLIARRFTQRADARMDEDDVGFDPVMEEVVIVGIADVDPEPLSTMGEAMDPDAVSAAHQAAPDRLGDLPGRGKNSP